MLGKSARTLPGGQALPPARQRAAAETGLAETSAGTDPGRVPGAGALLCEAAVTLAACLSVALVLALLGRHLAGG
ncbi:hypothetical protein ABMY26_34980 [Azospirillum sp. HJ39]|uniref:hypothetical protein n=1 Tax=Azospirillum sp. HJ39 TaxID=3159496 RepID=UPI00355711DC